MSEHDLTQRYYDGDLTVDEEAAALGHLAACARCQAELAEWMALDAAAGGATAGVAADGAAAPVSAPPAIAAPPPAIAAPPAPVIPLAPRRRRA